MGTSTPARPLAGRGGARWMIDRLRADQPAFHDGGRARWDVSYGTLELIASNVRPGQATLEVGCGSSTLVFLAAGARHVAVSPDPAEHRRVAAYAASLGVDLEGLHYRQGLSEQVLPCLEGRFSCALIDGAHSFPYPIVDYHFVSRLLDPGGILILDDLPIPSVGVLFGFLERDPLWERLAVVENRAAALRLTAPLPPGDPWGGQPWNRSYPDFSFLPAGRRLGAELAWRLSGSGSVRRVVQRWPAARSLAATARRRLGG
jgi:SAM-dependent methyltransferase